MGEPIEPTPLGVPSSQHYTEESRRFMEELLALEPGTLNGGLYANKSGYHNSRAANQANWPGNYSIVDGDDLGGPSDKAAAYDWTFPSAQAGNYDRMALYGKRLLDAYNRFDPRVNGWRESLGQTDSDRTSEGLDFRHHYKRTPDSSHEWHFHFSEDRSLVGDWNNKLALLSVLRGDSLDEWLEGDVGSSDNTWRVLDEGKRPEGEASTAEGGVQVNYLLRALGYVPNPWEDGDKRSLHDKVSAVSAELDALEAEIAALKDQVQTLVEQPPVDAAEVGEELANSADFAQNVAAALAPLLNAPANFTLTLQGEAKPADSDRQAGRG